MTGINIIVEDSLSGDVAEKLLEQSGGDYKGNGPFISGGKGNIRMNEINGASESYPHLVLLDQDSESECPPRVISREIKGGLSPNFVLCFATMEIESWLLADAEGLAKYLGVSKTQDRFPQNTDAVSHPKEHLIGIARRSRSRRIREGLVPDPEGTAAIGPNYNEALRGFVLNQWNARNGALRSRSLKRALAKLDGFGSRKPG